jgi:hypothetical protein
MSVFSFLGVIYLVFNQTPKAQIYTYPQGIQNHDAFEMIPRFKGGPNYSKIEEI